MYELLVYYLVPVGVIVTIWLAITKGNLKQILEPKDNPSKKERVQRFLGICLIAAMAAYSIYLLRAI